MKRILRSTRLTVAVIALATTALIAGCGAGSGTTSGLAVNAVMADPTAYSGQVTIKGVVQNVDPGTGSIAVIDEGEYATCGLTPCNAAGILRLTVPTSGQAAVDGSSYEGTLPALEDVVVVVGEFKTAEQGLYLDVARIEKGGSPLLTKR